MKVLIAVEDKYLKDSDGNYYSQAMCDYSFWQRYLQVFDEVLVLARVTDDNSLFRTNKIASGSGVSFIDLPYYHGPWQYIGKSRQIASVCRNALQKADRFILRAPGAISNALYRQLSQAGLPFALEVVGDPWDSLASGSVKSVLRRFLRQKMTSTLKDQCQNASFASFVTQYSLQERYPCSCWSTYYSSIDLPDTAFISADNLALRCNQYQQTGERKWKICHIGMMEYLYKAQDILIEAVSQCIKRGLKIELTLVGDGKEKGRLIALCQSLNIQNHVRFTGQIQSGTPIYEILDQNDLFVLPSRQEGLPRSVIEAMARGLPCISSTVGGNKELLTTDYLVIPDNTELLAQKIQTMLADPELLVQAARTNYQKSLEYRNSLLNARRLEFYNHIKALS